MGRAQIMDADRRAAKRAAAPLGALLVTAALGAACRAEGARETPGFAREIEALNRHLEVELGRGNLLGVADLFADDAVLIDARGERTAGRDEIDRYWTSIEDPVDWRIEIRRIRGSDAVAYEIGRSFLTTRRGGKLETSVSDFLVLWRREGGGAWRIELDVSWPVPE